MIDSSLTDAVLVGRFRTGDERAFDIIHARYDRSLVRAAERLLGPRRAAAEDIVQDGFLRAYRALRADEREISLAPWLHRIVRNRAMDELRRPPSFALDGRPPAQTPSTPDAGVVAQQREHLRLIVSDIASLPDRQREALVGHVLAGTPHAELARSLQVTVSATKNLINRARGTLIASERTRAAAGLHHATL